MAIITVGTIPATRFIKKAGINVDKNDFVTVDKHMKTNIDNILGIDSVYSGTTNTSILSVFGYQVAKTRSFRTKTNGTWY